MSTRRCAAGSNRSLTNVAIANRRDSRGPLSARDSASSTCDRARLSGQREALVHKDLRLSFDGNRYCVPPRYVGRHLTIKADASAVTIYDQYQEIASYARCWQRGQTFGAERFQKELLAQLAAAQRSAEQQRLVSLLVRPRNLTCVAWPIPTAR